jgi:SSS family solute:Na+ symporter
LNREDSLVLAISTGTLTWPDYLVLALYLTATVAIGIWMGRGTKSLGGYFLAERKTHWILACVSIIATDTSAISYMGIPGWVYQKDLKYTMGSLLMPPIMVVVVLLFVPLFFRLKVFTVYEYLEKRFHPAARTVTAILFLFLRGVHLGAAIYIPAVAFRTFIGVPEFWCIILIGILTTLYTLLGGMKAVIWTDFLQFIVMFGGLFLMIGIILAFFHWDVKGTWLTASKIISADTGTPHTTLVDASWSLKTESTLWALMAFYIIYNIGTYGADQVIVQRYFTMGSYKDIARSALASGFLNVIAMFALGYAGLLLTVYYVSQPALRATLHKPDEILPSFITHGLPHGVRGLIFAALAAATMSTLSAGLNSFSTVAVMDLYRRYGPGRFASEKRCLVMAKVFTVFFGALLTAVAIWVSTLHRPILEIFNRLASMFIGPITGIFLLGVLTKRGNIAGLLVGVPAGLAISFLMNYWRPLVENVNWMWTAPFGCTVTLLVGYLISIVIPDGESSASLVAVPSADGAS